MPRLPAASLAVLLLSACTPRPREAGGEEQPPPQVVLYGARMESYQGETLTLSGTAERLTYQRAGGDVQGTRAVLKVPPGQGVSKGPAGTSGGMVVSAPNMEGNLASKQLVASGGAVIRTGEGMVIETPRLTYDANTAQARGNEGVTVKGPDYRLRADRFEVSTQDETFIFEGSVETELGAAE
ncbi:LPS export ABC transporter periplasmic protein LptC [Pyxidicoccus parkwayensis]|uniref:LPS export ABC transporter periplasmic protein LptC n=1 Tax=Pyxidicoccus parkwayensis TaxID=2813578 RepID=A0ABX7NMV3_9BACT|nr:LPS export ABC transporter periplasmic protein LptC [Pyxidicoccus parkwaysis]QSQ20190.1 LPS export ABC transporter periplasmic protein LptC [Pyxidicoccus parkwaysis]